MIEATYILPIRSSGNEDLSELTAYVDWVSSLVDEVIVVDASPPEVFMRHHTAWQMLRHVAPDPFRHTTNGKVWGVLTGLDLASHERMIIADDDVRYDAASLARVLDLLDDFDVVRPQNYFEPMPWHARWDTGRSLLNRVTGGDWPGTLAVRRSLLAKAGGYNGDCLFENLELVRTVKAAGGREVIAQDIYVRRLPPTARHFLSQRVRQAYDEFARPGRLLAQLTLLPLTFAMLRFNRRLLLASVIGTIAVAESGRRRAGGSPVFPLSASLMAPLWLSERTVCAWLALGTRVLFGGVRYSGGRLRAAATPQHELDQRLHSLTRETVGARR